MSGFKQRDGFGGVLPRVLRQDARPGLAVAREVAPHGAAPNGGAPNGAVLHGVALHGAAPKHAAAQPTGTGPDGDSSWHEHGWGLNARQVGLLFLTILAVSLLLRLLGAVPGW